MNTTAALAIEVESFIVLEDWELARRAVAELPELAAERERLETMFSVNLDDLQDVLSLDPKLLENFKRRVTVTALGGAAATRDWLTQEICVRLDYCSKREELGWRIVEYILGLIDVLHTQGFISLLVLMIKQEYLDRLCKCPK